jgi:predicted DNA-binding transcriptional regulator AlpA
MQKGKWSAQQSIAECDQVGKTSFRAEFKELDAAALITGDEFAELLCVSRKSIDDRLRRGKIPRPVVRENRCVRWRVSDVRAWLEDMQQV